MKLVIVGQFPSVTEATLAKSVLERLRAFEIAQSGEQPDWRAVTAVLREAPQELRRYSPVVHCPLIGHRGQADAQYLCIVRPSSTRV